jgi:hypothetical protein
MQSPMRIESKFVAIVALCALAAVSTGCPALMIPSLAYQGYKYEKGKDEQSTETAKKKPAAAPQQSTSSSDIE